MKNLKESMAVLEKQDISDKKAEKVCIWHYFTFSDVRQIMRCLKKYQQIPIWVYLRFFKYDPKVAFASV